jgi:hypothetical protein
MHFMSIEVAEQAFLFRISDPVTTYREHRQRASSGAKQSVASKVPFSHNYLHDLESLWWVAIRVVFYNHFYLKSPLDDHPQFELKDVGRQVKLAQRLFPPTLKNTDRQNGFRSTFLEKYVGLPDNKTTMVTSPDYLRLILIKRYEVVESALPLALSFSPNSSEDRIYEEFQEVFSASKDDTRDLLPDFILPIYVKLLKETEKSKRLQTRRLQGLQRWNQGKPGDKRQRS